jgi:hypothetical protein
MVSASGCEGALTAVYGDMSLGAASQHFRLAELGWWLNGTCAGSGKGQCAPNAT